MPRNEKSCYGGKRSMLFSILIYSIFAISASQLVFAIPGSLTLQGKLTNLAGASQVGTYNFSFKIYDAYTEGNVLWQEPNRNITTDANGIYDIVLKNLSALNFSDQYYMGISVSGEAESQPRINLTSAPYSFRANISEDLNKGNKYEISVLNVTGNLTLGEGFDDVLTVTTGRLNISDGSIKAAGNLTLAEKIAFSLGAIIDNLVNGFLRINSGLNVTGNVSIAQDTLFVDNTSGRVGIGTALPGQKLAVIGNINATGNITSGTGTIILDATHDRIGIGTTQPTHALDVYGNVSIKGNLSVDSNMSVDGSTLFVDAENNRVGIGTALPAEKLVVIGNANISGTLNVSGRVSFPNLASCDSIDTDAKGVLSCGVDSGAGGTNSSLWNISGSNIFLREITGNVGIGTTTPAQTLTVQGRVNISQNLTVNNSVLFVDGTSGNVGIGTTGPGHKLEVSGTVRADTINIQGWTGLTASADDLILGSATQSWNPVSIYAGGSEKVTVTGGGNVGIGTTSPDNLLTILGNELTASAILHINESDNYNTSVVNVLTLDHVLKNPVNSTGGVGISILFRASDNASQMYKIANISAILYNATNGSQKGAITFSTSGSDTGDGSFGHLNERFRIDGSGRVGINITKPTSTLHVIGDANISGRLDVGKLNITGVTFSQGDLDISKSLRVAGGANISGDLGVLGNIYGEIPNAFKNANFTAAYDARTDRWVLSNFTTAYDLRTDRFNNENFTTRYDLRTDRYGKANYSEEYASTGFKTANYSTEYASTGYKLANFTSSLNSVNASMSLWNASGNNIFPRHITGNVGIGTATPLQKLEVAGNILVNNTNNAFVNLSGPIIRKSGNDIVISD